MDLMVTQYNFVHEEEDIRTSTHIAKDGDLYLYLHIGDTQIQGKIGDFERIKKMCEEVLEKAENKLKSGTVKNG